ncbi:hypothetical protein E1A91_A12G187300v1 [Gossypium mustelinum]|uniref:Dynein light chain n=1 Tax=Gossypium mustelinum TaxID=34275 RepID=A0A5D2WW51_GOSMU|nr:hypothetical protein E1A91_A12G187300v1 [Gossypium mustelinum]
MAHRLTHRRSLPAPEPNPSSHPLDPTLKKSPKPTITTHPTTRSSDLLMASKKPFFITNRFSRLSLNHKTQKPTNTQHSRDIHLQAKALTVSADADSSIFSLIKANHLLAHEKAKESLKESVRKASKDLGRKKQQQQQQQHHQSSVLHSKKLALTVKEKQLKKRDEGHDNDDMKKASASLGRRRSLGGSQVELGDILANCGVKIVSVDMPPFMQIHAVDCARKTHDSLEKFTSKALALTLKKEFDGVYGPAWHCIVGTSFGSFVTHSVGGFLYFSMDQKLYVLLFKTSVQRAD